MNDAVKSPNGKSVPSSAIAAELAAIGEDALDHDEVAWLDRVAERTVVDPQACPSDAARERAPSALQECELSSAALHRVWGRVNRGWWWSRWRQAWRSVRLFAADWLTPRYLPWVTSGIAAVALGVHSIGQTQLATAPAVDDDLVALGAIARAQLDDLAPMPADVRGSPRSRVRWAEALARPIDDHPQSNEVHP